jgi:hypothetical protein
MSKKIQLSEQETSEIRSLYPKVDQKILKEQYYIDKLISTYKEKCSGNNPISDTTVNVELKYNKDKEPVLVKFNLRAYFGAAKSSDSVYQEALSEMREQVYAELKNKKVIGNYDLVLVRIDSVIGSASNYLNGPLLPTHGPTGKPMPSVRLTSEPYVNLPKEGNSNWNKNKGYADNRWENMVSFINKNGKKIGFGIGKNLKPPKKTEFRITDTGGCTDETRDIEFFKNPGQFVIISGYVKLEPKPLTPDLITQLTECADGLKIIVGYFKKTMSAMDTGIRMTQSSTNHTCDYATFTVSCNGIPVGVSNMNNGKLRNNPKAMIGLNQENVKRRAPKQEGDTVYSVITVGSQELKRIITNSKNGKVSMTIQGTDGTLLRPRTSGRPGGGYHGEAPMVCAYVEDDDGSKRIVYGPQEPFGRGSGDVKPGVSKPMGSFNPCITIKEV